ncbi:GcrA family cell cycle regulator [Rhodoblastus sp.]|uniref:GcrA family cell cycle regulator n=1 Tax=Rhodoblastus sp. TaxID=1962975 RepID=UPI003F96CAF9
MTKTNESIERPNFENVLIERQDAASRFIGAQATSAKWMTLPGSRPVRLAELRNSMCRWPIGDPQHYDAFRFCGAACELGDSYCDGHKQMAFAPSKPQRKLPVGTISPALLQAKG